MSNSSALILLGILIIVTPFAGLTSGIQEVLLAIFGVIIFAIGFSMRAKRVRDMQAEKEESTLAQTQAPTFETTSNIG